MLKIGSRGSALALAQTRWVEEQIRRQWPVVQIAIQVIRTSADKDTKTSIRSASSTGVFVKEIEDALIAGDIDLAVHSMKDLPTQIPEPLAIGAIPCREDPHDALISRQPAASITDLPDGAVVGTGSIRRHAQLLALRPDLAILDIRGNVDTRLSKLSQGVYDAIVLACAGLNRLGLHDRITVRLRFDQMLPAPGQGALALECRRADMRTRTLISHLNDPATTASVLAEREFLRRIGGGCNSPVAVHARPDGDRIRVEGLVAAPDGTLVIRRSVEDELNNAEPAASALAENLLREGGRQILDALR